jgi:phospholipid/cholesterol/gamma-HCH transport system substrate-binding protein
MNRTRMLAYGAFGLAAVVLIYLVTSSGGSAGYVVRAEFQDVDGLRAGSTVKVDGVAAGIVSSISVTPRDTAIATLQVDRSAAPIGAGASLKIRPTDLLGEHYIQLTLGNLARPQASGTFIPMRRTSATVELDEILNMLDVNTRTRLRILINEAGIGLAGRGADFNTLLSQLPPNLGQAQQLLGQVASQNATLQNLITEGDRVTAAVNGKRDQLGNLIGVAEGALGAVAARHSQLGATIASAPGALAQLRTALDQVGTASAALTPTAASLQAAAGPLATTLRALPPFASSAHATLVTARRVAPDLYRLGRDAQPPLRALRPTAQNLQSVTRTAAPILTELDQRAMRDLLWFVENWALGLKGRDALGHFIGANLELDPSIVISALDAYLHPGIPLAGLHHDKSATTRGVATPSVPVAAVPSTAAASPAGSALGQHQPQPSAAPPAPPSASLGSSVAGNVQHLLDYLLGR